MINIFKNIINAILGFLGWKEKQRESEVPQGLQVWDKNGATIVDTSTKTTTIIDVIDITTANKTTTYTNEAFSSGNFFYIIAPYSGLAWFFIDVSIAGNTVTIENGDSSASSKVILGVY